VEELRGAREKRRALDAFTWGPEAARAPLPVWAHAVVRIELGGMAFQATLPVCGPHLPLEEAVDPEALRLFRVAVLEQVLSQPNVGKAEGNTARRWTGYSWLRFNKVMWQKRVRRTPRYKSDWRWAVIIALLLLRSPDPCPEAYRATAMALRCIRYVRKLELVGLVDPKTGKAPVCPTFVRREAWPDRYQRPLPKQMFHVKRVPVHKDFAALVAAYDPRDGYHEESA